MALGKLFFECSFSESLDLCKRLPPGQSAMHDTALWEEPKYLVRPTQTAGRRCKPLYSVGDRPLNPPAVSCRRELLQLPVGLILAEETHPRPVFFDISLWGNSRRRKNPNVSCGPIVKGPVHHPAVSPFGFL